MRPVETVERPPEEKIFRALLKKRKTLALAESCTGGLVSNLITDVPGSSKYFKGGVVAYSNKVKISLLGVSPSTIKKFGAVSGKTAREMADGVRLLMGSDLAAAITGIAGPSGSRPAKPVGLAYIAFSGKGRTIVKKIVCKGDRTGIKKGFALALLSMITRNI